MIVDDMILNIKGLELLLNNIKNIKHIETAYNGKIALDKILSMEM